MKLADLIVREKYIQDKIKNILGPKTTTTVDDKETSNKMEIEPPKQPAQIIQKELEEFKILNTKPESKETIGWITGLMEVPVSME